MTHPNVTKFIADNGDYVQNDTGDWWIFSSGGMIEPHNQFGALIPPFKDGDRNATPTMIKQTLRNKLYFAEKKLGMSIRAFEELKRELENRANESYVNCAVPPRIEEIDALHKLKETVLGFQELVTCAENELNPPPPTPSPEEQQRDAAAREQSKIILESIKEIEV